MARNRSQFQKGLPETNFVTLYGIQDLCRAAMARWRWSEGFVCPKCGGRMKILRTGSKRTLATAPLASQRLGP